MDAPAPKTRDRLLEAAFHLFIENGYDGTGLAQVLSASGLSKGAFYHYFATKKDIYREVVSKFFLEPLETLDPEAIASRPLKETRDRLDDFYSQLPVRINETAGMSMTRYFGLFFEAMSRLPEFRAAVQAHYLTLIEALTQRTYEEREVFPKVAEAHSRNVLATLEGRLFLNAILGDLAPLGRDER